MPPSLTNTEKHICSVAAQALVEGRADGYGVALHILDWFCLHTGAERVPTLRAKFLANSLYAEAWANSARQVTIIGPTREERTTR